MEANKQIRAALLQKARDWLLPSLEGLEVRRSIALRYSDAQLDEILILCAALEQFKTECLGWLASPAGTRQGRLQAFDQAFRTISEARSACQLFLPPKLLDDVARAISVGTNLLDEYPVDGPPVNDLEDPAMDATFSTLMWVVASIIIELRRTTPP